MSSIRLKFHCLCIVHFKKHGIILPELSQQPNANRHHIKSQTIVRHNVREVLVRASRTSQLINERSSSIRAGMVPQPDRPHNSQPYLSEFLSPKTPCLPATPLFYYSSRGRRLWSHLWPDTQRIKLENPINLIVWLLKDELASCANPTNSVDHSNCTHIPCIAHLSLTKT